MNNIAFFQLLLLPLFLNGQSGSYQYKLELDTFFSYTGVPIAANENKEIVLLLSKPNNSFTYSFVKFPAINGFCQGYNYTTLDPTTPPPYEHGVFRTRGDWAFYSGTEINNFSHLVALNLETGGYWSKIFYGPYVNSMPIYSFINNGDIFVLNDIDKGQGQINSIYPDYGVAELFQLDSLGNVLWKTGLLFQDALQGNNLHVKPRGLQVDAANNMYIIGFFDNANITNTNLSSQFLLKLDAQGIPKSWKKLNDIAFEKVIFTDNAIYLLDKKLTIRNFHTQNRASAIIAKFDYDFNLLWLKKYTAENFTFENADIAASPSGGLYLSSATEGVYPIIMAELDPDGNILSQKGYAHYNPRVVSLGDGSIAMASVGSLDSLGNPDPRPVIAKTDTNGEIAGCVTLPTCLEVSDTTVTFGTFHVEPHPVLDLEDVQLIVEPVSYAITPFCDYPPPPIPTFSFPDTLCLGELATSLSDRNRLAQAREWELSGPNVDSLLRDSFEFRYTFTEPGEYLLRQSVWVLGCRTDYERSITVLPPLTVAIAADSLICPDEPQEISAQANRTASYIWNNPTGASGQTLPLTASGTYTVTATDGHCEATDSATVTVVAGILGGQKSFTLPPDTTICHRDLPFLLAPQSAFSDVFLFENGAVQAASYSLTEAGTYKVRMEAFGCNFQQTFRLTVDCHADVYLPTSFSPNGDGINDVFGPLGTDFEVVELSIYDRWGGLVHKGKSAWDGGRASQGVYAYKLVYKDLLNLETVTRQGEVVLVK